MCIAENDTCDWLEEMWISMIWADRTINSTQLIIAEPLHATALLFVLQFAEESWQHQQVPWQAPTTQESMHMSVSVSGIFVLHLPDV